MICTRRAFLGAAAGSWVAAGALERLAVAQTAESTNTLARELGITTSSVGRHIAPERAEGKFTLLELPRILRDELDMKVIDLNTSTLASFEPAYLDKVRGASEAAGCVIINLKMNQPNLDMASPNADERAKAMSEYRRSIDAAARLGARWARPLPLPDRPDMDLYLSAYRELADYGAERGVEMLVENYGWMQGDADAVPKLIEALGPRVKACPDTGNWNDDRVRYEGLAKAFPLAVTCDFKARTLGPNGEHELYDLKRCFDVGWTAGFRGPWCFEHAHNDRATLFRELALLRDMLRGWMAAA